MEENTTALDCPLILFYISMKHLLKSRQLSEKKFLEQMVKHCKEIGFHNYSAKEIKGMWKKLISKYIDLTVQGTSEDREKWKYFEILDSCFEKSDFHTEERARFSDKVISHLIENFTNKKISCVIHGYENEQVLSEIQKACKSFGIFLAKHDIKQQWNSLTNIYKFLIDRGGTSNSWIHFDAMKSHYQDNFWSPTNKTLHDDKPRRLRERSKSAGPETKRKNWDDREKSYSVIKTDKRKRRKPLKNVKGRKLCDDPEDKKDDTEVMRMSTPTSKYHVINIDHSDICQKNGNFTINFPSITKQFSDNEFLPLKKRLRMEGDTDNNSALTNEDGEEYLGFFTSNAEDVHNRTKRSPSHQKLPKERKETSAMEKSPIVLIIKVDEGGSPVKACESTDAMKNELPTDSSCKSSGKSVETTKTRMQDSETPSKCAISAKRDRKSIDQTEDGGILSVEGQDVETDTVHDLDTVSVKENGLNDTSNSNSQKKQVNISPSMCSNVSTTEQIVGSSESSAFTGNTSGLDEEMKDKNAENGVEGEQDFVFRKPLAVDQKQSLSNGKCRLPVKVGGKLKEIFISQSDLSKINKFKPSTNCPKLSTARPTSSLFSGFKYTSQVIKPGLPEKEPIVDSSTVPVQSLEADANLLGEGDQRVDDFETESVMSEAVGEGDALKDNLLATVIDFQEQNNQEFIEIKNLMKQNNLLQRESNRLLRLILEKS